MFKFTPLLAGLLLILFAHDANALPIGRSITVLGDAWVIQGHHKSKLKTNQILQQTDIIVTGKQGRVRLNLTDGSKLYISPKSRIALKQYTLRKNKFIASFDMFWGKVRFLVKKLRHSGSKFNVRTTTAVLGVRGTDFEVNVTAPQNAASIMFDSQINLSDLPPLPTAVSLKTGAVVVTGSNGSQQNLAPGEQLNVNKSGEVSSPTPSGSTSNTSTKASDTTNASSNNGESNFANATAASTAASSGVTQGVTITTPYTYGIPQPTKP